MSRWAAGSLNFIAKSKAKNRLLEEMALTDALTGLPNRRAIDVWAPRQLSAAARHDFSIWAVMADLDLFKKVNDTYGHDAGDTVLKSFSEILRSNTRQSDMCARLGGEEFLVIITHSDKEGVKTVVERIRKQFENTKVIVGTATIAATASFGIAGFRGIKPPDLDAIVARADAAMYAAKHNGHADIQNDGVGLAFSRHHECLNRIRCYHYLEAAIMQPSGYQMYVNARVVGYENLGHRGCSTTGSVPQVCGPHTA